MERKAPRVEECRAITIQSPVVKVMEYCIKNWMNKAEVEGKIDAIHDS